VVVSCECGSKTSKFHKLWGISGLAEELLASQERLLHGVSKLVSQSVLMLQPNSSCTLCKFIVLNLVYTL
jgi:hypothetical protein